MKLNFKVDKDFSIGIGRLAPMLGFEMGEGGITVYAKQGERISLSYSGNEAVIYYKEKHQFFRELGLII